MRAALRMWRQRAVERERATRRIRAVRLSDGLIVQRWLRDRTRAFDRWRRGTADRHAAALLSALVAPAKQLRLLHSLSAAVDRWRRLLRDAAARHTHATLVYVLRARRALRRWRVARHLAHRRAEAKGPPRSPAQKEAASALAASTAATVARKQGFALLRRPSEEAAVGAARDRVADGLRLRRSLGTWAVAAVRLRYAGARRTSAMQHASAWHRARPGAALVLRRSLPRWRRAASRLGDERSRYRAAADVADAVALSAAVRRWERAAAAAAAAAGAACLADGHMAARRLAPAWRRLAERPCDGGSATPTPRSPTTRARPTCCGSGGPRSRRAPATAARFAAARSCGGAAASSTPSRGSRARRGRSSSRRAAPSGRRRARSRTGARARRRRRPTPTAAGAPDRRRGAPAAPRGGGPARRARREARARAGAARRRVARAAVRGSECSQQSGSTSLPPQRPAPHACARCSAAVRSAEPFVATLCRRAARTALPIESLPFLTRPCLLDREDASRPTGFSGPATSSWCPALQHRRPGLLPGEENWSLQASTPHALRLLRRRSAGWARRLTEPGALLLMK